MNNEFLISKLKEGQTINVIFRDGTKNNKEFTSKITIIGNSPLRKEIAYHFVNREYDKDIMIYNSGSFRSLYEFNKELIHKFLDKDTLKRVLHEEMNIAISINSLERALAIKEELQGKIKEVIKYNNDVIAENKKKWKLFK